MTNLCILLLVGKTELDTWVYSHHCLSLGFYLAGIHQTEAQTLTLCRNCSGQLMYLFALDFSFWGMNLCCETTLELPRCEAVALISALFPAPVRNAVSCVFSVDFLPLFLKSDFHGISHWSYLNEKETLLLKSHNLNSTMSS